jgi:8-oxo-dGTP pyrophosphatase MutT (NUDIX family)
MNWLTFFQNELKKPLPGEDAHLEMSPTNRLRSSEAKNNSEVYRESAVAIHLIKLEDELQVLLTQRSEYVGVHSGQISFPGGKVESSDKNGEYTARRESFEETGIPILEGEYLGELTDVFIPVSHFNVQPHLFYHHTQNWEFLKDPREVAEIFWMPVQHLLNPKSKSIIDIPFSNRSTLRQVPCFHYENRIIWGATAIILNEFKEIVKKV